MVVDLAVGDQHGVLALQRLATIGRADDGQPAVGQHRRHPGRTMNCQLIRPAMGNAGDHALGQLLVGNTPQADKTTHEFVFTSFLRLFQPFADRGQLLETEPPKVNFSHPTRRRRNLPSTEPFNVRWQLRDTFSSNSPP